MRWPMPSRPRAPVKVVDQGNAEAVLDERPRLFCSAASISGTRTLQVNLFSFAAPLRCKSA
jgi:hypothetical protein